MKRKPQDIPARLSIDSSVILVDLLGESLGALARTVLEDRLKKLYFPHTAIAEAYYILCRRRGHPYAEHAVFAFLEGMFTEVVSSEELDQAAGRYKCERSISLADCYVLAAAKLQNASALFAEPETDLTREIKSRSFDVDILFLSEL